MAIEAKIIPQLAKDLRIYAELTARNSQNWDNFEDIALKMLEAVSKASK